MSHVLFTAIDLKELQSIIAQTVRQELTDLAASPPGARPPEPDELLDRAQAAKLLRISLVTLYEYTNKGILPAYRCGTRLRYKRTELLSALKQVHVANPRPPRKRPIA
jgi:excisionase family DNA binding protein